MPSYLLIRDIHISCLIVTASLLLLRTLMQLVDVNWRVRWPVMRCLPHVNDVLLLGAGLTLMLMSGQYPDASDAWLTGKLVLLLIYILASRQAVRQDRSRRWARAWPLVAITSMAGILTLARTPPMPAQIPDDICRGQRVVDEDSSQAIPSKFQVPMSSPGNMRRSDI